MTRLMGRQLVTEQQEHDGAVATSTPSVQYFFEDASSGSNEIRLNQLTYTNGRTIARSYCHRALQNQPLMGASKPATELAFIYGICPVRRNFR